MPYVFYNSSAAGGQLSLVASDQTNVALELRDVAAPPAVDIGYTPADALAWAVPPPDDVAEALDELATGGRAAITTLSSLSGSSPGFVADSAAVVTPVKSGRFLMFWQVSGSANAVTPANLLCRLRIDGVEQASGTGSVMNLREPGTGVFYGASTSLITTDRTVSHTVGINFTFSAGSLSASTLRVSWWEI